ncbi:hypothetical protein LIER_02952 [Lithospermum erythrorhizon]|uniref:GEX2 N-terminal Ig-like domain-containing protein n=1 Tax=Lithospermum erythrorhizon TaxID=34254 RepID=A0AAV3NU46_LITER
MLSNKSQLIFIFITLIFSSFLLKIVKSESPELPKFVFSWPNNNGTFVAGDVANINIRILGNYESAKYEHPFSPNITVNERMGNGSYISWITCHFDQNDFGSWRISFLAIMAGSFVVLIEDDNFKVFDSSLHFDVSPGPIYPAAGIVSWIAGVNNFEAGNTASIMIVPQDAFGNNISSPIDGSNLSNFSLSAFNRSGYAANILNVSNKGWNHQGHLRVEFIPTTAGSLVLSVEVANQTLIGSPLAFKVNPGPLVVSSCIVLWKVETKFFQLFSVMEAYILQRDHYGNPIPGLYAFDIKIVEKGTNLSMPISDLRLKEVGLGVQLFSFRLDEPGDFMLIISDKEQDNMIAGLPYEFTVYVGYCDGLKSIINGSGLNNSIAGVVEQLSIFLKDAYLYPSPVEMEKIKVQIMLESDQQRLPAIVHPKDSAKGNLSIEVLNDDAIHMDLASARLFSSNNETIRKSEGKLSAFNITFVPEKIGFYEIQVFCGNIQLNGGRAFKKEVTAGDVNMSISGLVKFWPKVSNLMKNDVVVQLLDSHHNPVLLQQAKLKLEIGSLNKSGFQTWDFVDNQNGSYTASFMAKDIGKYELCASYEGKRFHPCPFGVDVHSYEYFPKVRNDVVSVWEDESITFDVLKNDYFPSGNASIIQFSMPHHGSLLQYGPLFIYTPYKGFYGNDSFSYTISDVNKNLASGSVDVSVLCVPPQFVSVPNGLVATEDAISPTFGGFAGFKILYSNMMENITITIGAQNGTIFLSPMFLQFWQPIFDELIVNQDLGKSRLLTLVGSLEVINSALQTIQYFGNANFSGTDIISISTINQNGKNNLDFPIVVEPINDPPFIKVPEFIILDEKMAAARVFDRQKDKFDFFIGDPDLLNPGNESHFLVMFSMEVSSGVLSTNLPSKLISTIELKLKSSYQWQPLQTFVTISKHSMVAAKGIRFTGTISDCNSIMQDMLFYVSEHSGSEHSALLSIVVNDLGNHGCYPDCVNRMSVSVFAEATVYLFRKRPISSLVAHALGTAIVVEFIFMVGLGGLFIFFICRCAKVLIHEKRKQHAQDSQDLRAGTSPTETIELAKVYHTHS